MDFKTRFQGKMTRISKDGGIEDMVRTTTNPINRVEKVSVRALQMDAPGSYETTTPKISYGNTTQVPSPRQQFPNHNN